MKISQKSISEHWEQGDGNYKVNGNKMKEMFACDTKKFCKKRKS